MQVRPLVQNFQTSGYTAWAQAANEANAIRNTVMDTLRGRSTPVGHALAQSIKSQGRTLNEMVARKTVQLFGPGATFTTLSQARQNRVYSEIVRSAGRSNPTITARMRTWSRAGRGLIVLSIGLSVYNIATSDQPGQTAVREVAVTGAGIGGGIAGGALAGLACGPGAPVCVTVGAFVGGALAAFGVDMVF
ncbi:hypothetical protein GHC57_05065 [Roseospira navarrensis]|uniref:Uncharacterized protein n=2 Tax=Roseospira navarrensis TaxID=140058 RepID=A0A7X1ZC85_9PROT|nr:hypothetical protein [Roseospira navarrensis]